MPVPSAMLTPRAVLLSLVVGAATGAFIALIAERISRRGKPALVVDGILGAIGYAGGAIGLGFLPAMQHSTTTRAGDLIIHTTTRNYGEAYRVAFGVAALLPVLYEMYRYQRARREGKSGAESRTK
jgi:MFS family permease